MADIFANDDYLQNGPQGICIRPYVIVNGTAQQFTTSPSESCTDGSAAELSYAEAKRTFGNTDMEIVLGELNPEQHTAYAGGVRPYCGVMTVSLNNNNPSIYEGGMMTGVGAIELFYYDTVQSLLGGVVAGPRAAAGAGIAAFGERGPTPMCLHPPLR